MSDATKPHVVCVVPSRFGAERFPGKPLAPLLGKPMVQWTVEAALAARGVDEVLVATDDERIAEAARACGVEAVMTPPECPSGTDRIAAAMAGRRSDIVINVQGDEPAMRPETIAAALQALLDNPRADVSTACVPLHDRAEFEAPHIVKVVRASNDAALYFSRAPIPSLARVDPATAARAGWRCGYKHLGIYVYRRESLESFVRLEPSPLELRERLEQLRFMEAGATIVCPEVVHDSVGVDTPEDVPLAEALLRKLKGGA